MRTFVVVLKWFVGVGLVLALVLGGAGVFLYPHIKKMIENSGGKQGTEVRVLEVDRGRLVRTISAPGVVEPRNKISIAARVQAQIMELPFEEGDFVKEGDVVVRLDDRDLQAAVDSAEASLRADEARLAGAKASHVNAVAEWERTKALFESNDMSKSLLEAAEAELHRMESNLRAVEQNIEVARARAVQATENMRYATIIAPIDGRVVKLNRRVGEIVVIGTMNNPGTVIMDIADLSSMMVKAQVNENDVAPVKEGQTARIYINAFPNEVFEGTVEKVSLQETLARDNTKHYETEIVLHLPADRVIYSGLSANVDIEIETVEGVLLAPSQAVIDVRVDELPTGIETSPHVDRNKTFARIVYTLQDGKAIATPVQIGASDLTKTAILSGLDEGAEVIVGPWKALQQLKHEQVCTKMEETEEATTDVAKAEQQEGEAPADAPAPEAAPASAGDGKTTGAAAAKDGRAAL